MIELTIATKKNLIKKMILTQGTHLIGNNKKSAVPLCYPTVSKEHALISVERHAVHLTDLKSKNGTFINHHQPIQDHCLWLKDCPVSIGPFQLRWTASLTKKNISELIVDYSTLYEKKLNENKSNAKEWLLRKLEYEEPQNKNVIYESILDEFHGEGPLKDFIHNPQCLEIIINQYDEIFLDLGKGLFLLQKKFRSQNTFERWAKRKVHQAGQRLDVQHPICEATLHDGARFHAVLNPISTRSLSIAIRRFGSAPITEKSALASQWITPHQLHLLQSAIETKQNIVISGGTSTGKTSLLNFLCTYLPDHERIITIEDIKELSPPVKNLVQLQSRKPNADGVGEITLRMLIQSALRMRPDRIIVGECRGDEVIELLQALNTGHPGTITTIHANSTHEAIQRLELLALLGAPNLSIQSIRRWIKSTVNLVIQVERKKNGKRVVQEIYCTQKNEAYH